MKFALKPIFAALGLMAMVACTNEAGQFLDEGGFGNPTMNNIGVQTGDQSFAIAMTRKFAADVNPVVNFAFDSAQLDGEAQAVLRRQADWIKQFPEVRFRVYGHTDLVGSAQYNRALGQRRANAVVNYLVSQGISRSRLEAVVSFGKTQPLVVTSEPDRRNRRAVTEVSGLAKGKSAPLNGKYAEVIWREYVDSATRGSDVVRESEVAE
ncbi:MAG: OmpA family protein [Pseudomonadota bacterium]